MAKELPYFRFTVQEWQNGDISLERFELQGLFISVCGFYWLKDCDCTLAMLNKKYSNATSMLDELIELGILKHENRHDKVQIVFLNNQYDLLSEKRKRMQDAGSKGGKAKAKLKQKDGYKDKDNNKDKDKDKEYKAKNELEVNEVSFKYLTKLEIAINEFKKMRTEIKKKLTNHALDLILKKLDNLAPNNDELKVLILNQSIEHSYQTVYPLKKDYTNGITNPNDRKIGRNTESEIKAFIEHGANLDAKMEFNRQNDTKS